MDSDEIKRHPHVEDSVRSVAELYAEHDRKATPYQRFIERLVHELARERVAASMLAVIAFWVFGNLVLSRLGARAFDPPPFQLLQGAGTFAALIMTVLILSWQQHEDRLAARRAQLSLHIALVTEQKIAKLIELVEGLRRDDPNMTDRDDAVAEAMAEPVDTTGVLDAIREAHTELVAET